MLARTSSLSSVVDGDAPTTASLASSRSAVSFVGTKSKARAKPMAPPSTVKHHTAGPDGLLRTNRKGITLCEELQHGKCNDIAEGTIMICGRDKSKVHQCARCLQPGHGASSCSGTAAKQPVRGAGRGGRSKTQH